MIHSNKVKEKQSISITFIFIQSGETTIIQVTPNYNTASLPPQPELKQQTNSDGEIQNFFTYQIHAFCIFFLCIYLQNRVILFAFNSCDLSTLKHYPSNVTI